MKAEVRCKGVELLFSVSESGNDQSYGGREDVVTLRQPLGCDDPPLHPSFFDDGTNAGASSSCRFVGVLCCMRGRGTLLELSGVYPAGAILAAY